jgi:hypothetical protein
MVGTSKHSYAFRVWEVEMAACREEKAEHSSFLRQQCGGRGAKRLSVASRIRYLRGLGAAHVVTLTWTAAHEKAILMGVGCLLGQSLI